MNNLKNDRLLILDKLFASLIHNPQPPQSYQNKKKAMATTTYYCRADFKSLIFSLPPLEIPTLSTMEQDTFTLFPKLPLELRRHIWANVASQPRKIDLLHIDRNFSSRLTPNRQSKYPAILATCQESRSEGLRFYIPITEMGLCRPNPNRDPRALTYINLHCDHFRSRIWFREGTWEEHELYGANLTKGKIFPLQRLASIPFLQLELKLNDVYLRISYAKLGKKIALAGIERLMVVFLLDEEKTSEIFESNVCGRAGRLVVEIELRQTIYQQVAQWGKGNDIENCFQMGNRSGAWIWACICSSC
ncbi:hypothetical protein N431DRAFT_455660 [Stipitochalara longipes BDJ]|nr:hypothetical protein N431DRAFT_455660 [Stipitochalara longipes BDJ]